MLVVCMVASLALIMALHMKKNEYPVNMYLLASFTLVESYAVATVVTFYK